MPFPEMRQHPSSRLLTKPPGVLRARTKFNAVCYAKSPLRGVRSPSLVRALSGFVSFFEPGAARRPTYPLSRHLKCHRRSNARHHGRRRHASGSSDQRAFHRQKIDSTGRSTPGQQRRIV